MANLTSKELSGIEDQLKCEQTLISKCEYYAENTNDNALKMKLKEISQKHQNHYNQLYSLLG